MRFGDNDPVGLPTLMSAAGDTYSDACRISAIVWESSTSAGDVCEIQTTDGKRIWKGRASDTNTYLGVSFGNGGVAAPKGFKLTTIGGTGSVMVYLVF